MKKTIQIKCKGADLLPYESLIQFQGDLKTLSKKNLEKLKQQIIKNGFVAPFYIWVNDKKNQILDGSQRNRALKSLIDDGYEIPLLPVVYIEADNEADAKEKLLAISSQYGEWNKLELETWLDGIDDEIRDTLRFVDTEINNKIDDIEDYRDLEKELEDLEDMEEFKFIVQIPIMYKDKLLEWIANGEQKTQIGFGKGLLRRCELL